MTVNNLEDTAKKSFWILASSSYAWQVLSWIFTIFTIRFLSPADYGLMSMIGALTPYLGLLASFQLATWAVQRENFTEDDQKALLPVSTMIGIVSCVLGIAMIPAMEALFKEDSLSAPMLLVAPTFILKGMSAVPEALLRRHFKFGKLAFANITANFCTACLQLLLAYKGFGYWALVYGFVCNEIVKTVLLFALAKPKFSFSFDKEICRDALAFGVPAAASSLMWIFYSTIDNVYVGRTFGASILGIYTMAFFLVEKPASKLAPSLKPVLISYFSRVKSDYQALTNAFLKTNKFTCLVLLPFLFGLGVTAEEAILVVLGEDWVKLPIYVLGFISVGIFRSFVANVDPLMLSLNKPKLLAALGAFASIAMPLLVIGFGILEGIPGMFVGWGVYQALYFVVVVAAMDKKLGISPTVFFKSIAPSVLFSCIMAVSVLAAAELFTASLLVTLIVKILTGIAVYALCLRVYLGPKFLKKVISLGIDGD